MATLQALRLRYFSPREVAVRCLARYPRRGGPVLRIHCCSANDPKRTCCASPISESHGDVALVLPPADRLSEAAVQVAWEQFERHRGDGNSQKAPEALKKKREKTFTLLPFSVCAPKKPKTKDLNRAICAPLRGSSKHGLASCTSERTVHEGRWACRIPMQ